MSRRPAPPKYRTRLLHGKRRALVTLRDSRTGERRDVYLGDVGSAESLQKYARILAEWEACGRRLPGVEDSPALIPSGPTITQLCYAFWVASEGHYSTQQLGHFKTCCRYLRQYYGETPVADFGPKALRLMRDEMVRGPDNRKPWTRGYVNRTISLIRFIFRWGVSHEMVPVTVLQSLKTVEPLKRGRTKAPESEPVRPVDPDVLKATLPFLSCQVKAVIELQLLTGARPAELLDLRPCDFVKDEYPNIWVVHLSDHKTAYRGRKRAIYFGPQAQVVLEPFLEGREDTAYLFDPSEAECERRAALHANRTTPMSCGNTPGSNRKESPQRRPHSRYTSDSYRRAIDRACEKAFPPPKRFRPRKGESIKAFKERLTPEEHNELKAWYRSNHWHPYQLRHNAATSLRRAFGLEAAQLILGHSSACITDAVYADRDQEKIVNIVQEIG